MYIAYKYALGFKDRIREPYGPLKCIDKADGIVTVGMMDGSPFLNGAMTLVVPHNRIVLNPPPAGVVRAS